MTARARFSIGVQNTQIRIAEWSDKYGPLSLYNGAVIVALSQENSERIYIDRIKVGLATQNAPCNYVVSLVSIEYAAEAEKLFLLEKAWHTNRECPLTSVVACAPNSFSGTRLISKYVISNGRGFQWVAACEKDFIEVNSMNFIRFLGIVISFPVDEAENLALSDDANNPSVSLELFGEA